MCSGQSPASQSDEEDYSEHDADHSERNDEHEACAVSLQSKQKCEANGDRQSQRQKEAHSFGPVRKLVCTGNQTRAVPEPPTVAERMTIGTQSA